MTITTEELLLSLWDSYLEAGTSRDSTENGAIDLYDIDGMFEAARALFDAGNALAAELITARAKLEVAEKLAEVLRIHRRGPGGLPSNVFAALAEWDAAQ